MYDTVVAVQSQWAVKTENHRQGAFDGSLLALTLGSILTNGYHELRVGAVLFVWNLL